MNGMNHDIESLVNSTFERLTYLKVHGSTDNLMMFRGISDMIVTPGQPILVSIIAAPGTGRTALASQTFAWHMREGRSLFYSIDQAAGTLCMRLLVSDGRVDSLQLMSGQMNERHFERLAHAAGRLASRNAVVVDAYDMTPADIVQDVANHAEQDRIALVVVDGLELLNLTIAEKDTAILAFRALSRRHNCAVIVTLPTSMRESAHRLSKRPLISDVREVTNLETASDVILGLYRDEMHNSELDVQGIAEFIVLKNKNGPVGRVKAQFHTAHMRFNDLAPDGV